MTSYQKVRPALGSVVGLTLIAAALGVNVRLGTWPGAYPAQATAQVWLITVAILVAFMALVGQALNGRPAGLLIDNRNRVSLSKFQAAAWTVLVMSALTTLVAARIRVDAPNPLDITIPGELLAAMGISAASLVLTPAVLSMKADAPAASPEQVARTAAKLGVSPETVDAEGRVFGRVDAASARWLDMFRGEDVSNAGSPDLSKVQNFLITLLLVVIYAAAILSSWSQADVAAALGTQGLAVGSSLPALNAQFLWLMGISHASYLAYKAAPHGPPPKRDPDVVPPADAVG